MSPDYYELNDIDVAEMQEWSDRNWQEAVEMMEQGGDVWTVIVNDFTACRLGVARTPKTETWEAFSKEEAEEICRERSSYFCRDESIHVTIHEPGVL